MLGTRLQQKVLVLGATGSIGTPIVKVLLDRGHDVTALARSANSATKIKKAGAAVLSGDITNPDKWIDQVPQFDAVIHAANTWSDDMAEVDTRLTNALLEALSTPEAEKTLIYTDGCWTYGSTGDVVATEETPHNPMPLFADSVEIAELVHTNQNIRGMVIFPAMVYVRDGGVLDRMISSAMDSGAVEIIGSAKTRWTMVHSEDLAELYALMLEKGESGSRYNGAGTIGIEVGKIADVMAKRLGIKHPAVIVPVDDTLRAERNWYEGYAIDQQMSGAKAMRELGWNPQHLDVLEDIA